MPDYVTESYLRRAIEVDFFAPRVLDVMLDLAYSTPFLDRFAYEREATKWQSEGYIGFGADGHTHPPFAIANISRFYAPGGKVNLGPLKELDSGTGTTGQYTTIRNGGTTDIEHEVDKSVSITDETSSELHEGIQLDMTTEESVEYGGVSAKMEEHLGITVDATQAQSHSKTTETSFSDKIVIPGGAEDCIVYSKGTKHFSQDYAIAAIADLSFDIYRWGKHDYALKHDPHAHFLFNDEQSILQWSSHHQRYSMSFKSVHEFVGFLRGYDTRAPGMKGYYDAAGYRARQAIRALEDLTNFHVQLTGTNMIESQGDADYSVTDVAGISDDEIKERYGEPGKAVPPSIPHHVLKGA